MEAKVNFVVVGVFVLILSTALIAGLLWLSSGKYYRKTYDTYVTYMSESVSGLNLNAPVRYLGVEVGRVRKIALAPNNVEQVELTLDIERGTPIKVDTIALLQTQGLTGIAFVDLESGHRNSPALRAQPGERYPVIQSGPSLMNRLEASVPTLLASLNRVSDNLNAVLDQENREALKQTLADLQLLAHTLAARSATIDAGLADAARTMHNTARLTAELPGLVRRVERSADEFDRMTAAVTGAGRAVAGAGEAATGVLDSTSPDLQRFTSETLPEVRALVAQLRELTATLQRTVDKVERNPSVLLFGRPLPKPGPGE
jgi:phospholipid/cholesterol/gamma-HCH transport system substrate-binding protein